MKHTPTAPAVFAEPLEGRTMLTSYPNALPTGEEQYMLELINRARANPAAEAARYNWNLNEGITDGQYISTAAKQPLTFSTILQGTARVQSQWVINTDVLSHTGPDNTQSGDRMRIAGYPLQWPYGTYENIGWTGYSSDSQKAADDIHKLLFVDTVFSGRAHRKILMEPKLEETGLGMIRGNFQGYDAVMGTQDFAFTSQYGSGAFLTGVAYQDTVRKDNFYSVGEGLGNVTVTAHRTSDGATFNTSTFSSGGYRLWLAPGTYDVTATGGGISGMVKYAGVTVNNDFNVKKDFRPDWASGSTPTPPPPAAGPTPYLGSPFSVGQTIEAENYDNGGQGVGYSDTTGGNSGGKYRGDNVDIESSGEGGYDVGWVNAGDWLHYTINAGSTGTYNLEARVASPTAGGSFHVEIDGNNVTGAIAMPNTGGFQKWSTLSRSGITLSAGQHKVKVVFDSNSSGGFVGNINWIRFVTPSSPPPASTTTIQAEDFTSYYDNTSGNSGGAYRSTNVDIENTQDSGGGYDIAYTKAGEWLGYNATLSEARAYTLDVRIASPASGGTYHVEIDGKNITGTVSMGNTGGWQSWQTRSTSGINLSAGTHAIRIVFDSNGSTGFVGNVNWLRLS